MLICCVLLPDATISSVPILDFMDANEGVALVATDQYFVCCGKSICGGFVYSFGKSGNHDKCPFCNAKHIESDEEKIEELMKRVEANDAGATFAWVVFITMDSTVCFRMERKQLNYGLRLPN